MFLRVVRVLYTSVSPFSLTRVAETKYFDNMGNDISCNFRCSNNIPNHHIEDEWNEYGDEYRRYFWGSTQSNDTSC